MPIITVMSLTSVRDSECEMFSRENNKLKVTNFKKIWDT